MKKNCIKYELVDRQFFGKEICLESEKTVSSMYIISTFLPIIEGLIGTGYAARQIQSELIPAHDGGRYHDELNLHNTIIVSVF